MTSPQQPDSASPAGPSNFLSMDPSQLRDGANGDGTGRRDDPRHPGAS